MKLINLHIHVNFPIFGLKNENFRPKKMKKDEKNGPYYHESVVVFLGLGALGGALV